MTTQNVSMHRATIALSIPAKIPALILYGTNVVQRLTGNPHFPAPTPTVAALAAAVADLHDAETSALSRTKGAVTVRNDKRTTLVGLLQQYRGYVQGVADATPENGAAIIESAGLSVRKIVSRGRRPFAVVQGAVSGEARITALTAGSRAAYDWQYSLDVGKTWIDVPSTTRGQTTIVGLPVGTNAQFRYRTVTPKSGQGDWSAAVALFVK